MLHRITDVQRQHKGWSRNLDLLNIESFDCAVLRSPCIDYMTRRFANRLYLYNLRTSKTTSRELGKGNYLVGPSTNTSANTGGPSTSTSTHVLIFEQGLFSETWNLL